MSDITTDPKPYVTGSRREYRAGRYRYTVVTHRASCVYGRYIRQRTPADNPVGHLARCCAVDNQERTTN